MEVIPYLASIGWYASWLKAVTDGFPDNDAIRIANNEKNVCGKDYTRCLIKGGSSETLLSIPVEGGASRQKRASDIPHLGISEHGNWRHTHMGALNAAYGRAPYYQHFMPMLETIYNSGVKSLKTFNEMVHSAVVNMLLGNGPLPEILKSYAPYFHMHHGYDPARGRGREIAGNMDLRISIIDLLMANGRESILPLLSSFNPNPRTLNTQHPTLN